MRILRYLKHDAKPQYVVFDIGDNVFGDKWLRVGLCGLTEPILRFGLFFSQDIGGRVSRLTNILEIRIIVAYLSRKEMK